MQLSDEQSLFVETAQAGKNILVDACIGSGKTTAIQTSRKHRWTRLHITNLLKKNLVVKRKLKSII